MNGDRRTSTGSEGILDDALNRISSDNYTHHDLELVITLIGKMEDTSSLLLLFDSTREDDQLNAIYIVSEADGQAVRHFLGKATEYTRHAHWQARYWALACILRGSEPSDCKALAAGIRLLIDPDERVRSKAIDFASRLSRVKMLSAREGLGQAEDGPLVEALSAFIGYFLEDLDALTAAARSDDPLRQAFALAFAARISRIATKIARKGSRSADPAISELAKSLL